MHGQGQVMLNLFHRIVLLKLLKLSIAYSQVQLEREQEQTEDLIRDITFFSAIRKHAPLSNLATS